MELIETRCVAWFDEKENRWQAVALDMDIIAEGESASEAIAELNELIGIQVGFAVARDDLDCIWRSAPRDYWRRYLGAE